MNATTKFAGIRCLAVTSALALATVVPSDGSSAGMFQDSREWKEEVNLSSGETLVIERVDFIGRKVPLVERSLIRFKTKSGKEVTWESCANPVALDSIGENFYVVGSGDFTFCARELKTYEPGGLAAWSYNGSDFKRIGVESVPKTMVPNLVYVGKNAVAHGRLIRHYEKRGDLHVVRGINWCEEAWRAGGNLAKCNKQGSK